MPRYFLTALVTVLIIIAVLTPGSKLPGVDLIGFDKLVHFGMFATWAVAVRYDLPDRVFAFWLVLTAGLTFSILTEVLQILAEGRTFDVYDMLADAIGLLAGLLVSKKIVSLMKNLK
jgi:VanZ family protein